MRSIGDEFYAGPQDIRNFRADRADLSGLARHVFRLNYLYDLPIGKGKPFLNYGGLQTTSWWLADRGNYERPIRHAVVGDVSTPRSWDLPADGPTLPETLIWMTKRSSDGLIPPRSPCPRHSHSAIPGGIFSLVRDC